MARVTVEDCLDKIDNRFELVLTAAKRAHQLNNGTHKTTLDAAGDKNSIIALKEIAKGLIDKSILTELYDDYIPKGGVSMEEVQAELSETILEEKEAREAGIVETDEN